jgi:hypothetical protein
MAVNCAASASVSVPHGRIDLLAGKVDMMHGCRNAQIGTGVRLGKMAEPMHQPFGGKIRRGADGKETGVLPLQQARRSCRNAISPAHGGVLILTGA